MQQAVTVPVKKLDETLAMPAYAYVGDAGLDLRAAEDAVLQPFERKLVACGIAMAIPQGYAGFVVPRSGLAAKKGITVLNAPGTIDADYRGEVCVILVNLSSEPFVIERGERIAQLVLAAHERVEWEECESLSESDRGEGGFGSTGTK